MRSLFKGGLRALAAGAIFAIGVLSIAGVYGATLSLFTGPAGSNPANQPNMVADLNTLVNSINANAAFGGTGIPSQVIGALSTTTSKFLTTPTTALQIMNTAVITTTTGSNTCNVTGASWCLGILDPNGNLHWLAGT